MSNLHLYQYAEALSFIFSTVSLRKLWGSVLSWTIPYLAFVVYIEILSVYFPIKIGHGNHWMYNLYLLPEYFYFTSLFYTNSRVTLVRRGMLAGSGLFILFYVFNICFFQRFLEFNNQTFLLSCLLLTLYACLQLWDLIRRDDDLPLHRHYIFFICTGCLIFFVGYSALFSVYFFYKTSFLNYARHRTIYWTTSNVLNVIHYLCICAAIWTYSKFKND